MNGPLLDAEQAAAKVWEAALRPPPPPDLNAWAEENIVFGRDSPIPGRYRRTTIPLMTRILECLGPDHPARVVTLMGGAQIFKTTVGQIFLSASLDLDPCDMLYVHPTHDNAIRWSRTKWRQMRAQSDVLTRLLGDQKSRDSTDTLLYQERRDGRGSLQISGANSPASLSMLSVPRQVQDDLSKWENNTAGDPERQADNRSAAFEWAKILKISTPLFKQTCRVTRAYEAGTQERWHVPCPHCAHMQPLEWSNFEATIDPDDPDGAHFTCVSCGSIIEHTDKRRMITAGCWVADNPGAKEPSFHVWRAYSPTRDWGSIAREWLTAQGDPLAEQTFFNDVLGLPYERAADAPPWAFLRDRAAASNYDRGHVPTGALLICAGIDVQVDRVEVHVKGFGSRLRRWTIDYEIIPHHISTDECRQELDELLTKTWPDDFGNLRPLDMAAIDGNAWTRDVFMWARRHTWRRVIVVRGAKSELAPPLALTREERRPDGTVRKAQKRFYNVGVSLMKSTLYEQMKKTDPEARGYCAYPRGLSEEFFVQATAEKRVVETDRWGHPRSYWRLDHARNEVLDTEMYAEAAAIRCGWYTRSDEHWQRLSEARETPGAFPDKQAANGTHPGHVSAPNSRSKPISRIAELSAKLHRR